MREETRERRRGHRRHEERKREKKIKREGEEKKRRGSPLLAMKFFPIERERDNASLSSLSFFF